MSDETHPLCPRLLTGTDFPPFTIVWEDLQHACRLALEIERVPDDFQAFNMMSYQGQGKYLFGKAERILGYTPLERVERYYRRPTGTTEGDGV